MQAQKAYQLGGGGKGTQQTFKQGGSAPRSNPFITHLYTTFHEKRTPSVYLLLTHGIPFTYLFNNLASLLTDVNALSFK